MSGIDDLIAARQQAAARAPADEMADQAMVRCDRLVRIFTVAGVETQALQGLDLVVRPGELTALVGASGSGKSTLLNILAGLDRPTGGQAKVAGHDLLTMGAKERLRYRRSTVGFLWQQTGRNLLAQLTAAENVELPMELAHVRSNVRRVRARDLLDLLGLSDCRDRLIGQLSGGQQQRVAIGVALANNPGVLLADEPTGELDTETADEVFAALRKANTEIGVTILVVTHDAMVTEHVNRTVAIRDGRISTEVLRRTATDSAGHEAHEAQEYSVLDRAGRLQLPGDFIEALALKDRVRLALEPDHVGVWPDRDRAVQRESQ
ncbi:MAG TPA: ABC transporter ATP-binding protein [Streptosporangiaceae bacterium]|nr:ABC transporter ATP-binding protein [Streptosporangiaceae bacterium]